MSEDAAMQDLNRLSSERNRLKTENARLRDQRDKLLAACEACVPLVDVCPNAQYYACDCVRCEAAFRLAKAIAAAKEGR